MATEQYLQRAALQHDFDERGSLTEKSKSLSTKISESEADPGGFECNICLEVVQDPVVTLCGHLYCWPCIYRWISFENKSPDNLEIQQPQCPVCKAEISQKTLIPLYGRGGETPKQSDDKSSNLGIIIPQRPPTPRCGWNGLIADTNTNYSRPVPQLQPRGRMPPSQTYHPNASNNNYTVAPTLGLGETNTNLNDPIVRMVGEMVYERIFGNNSDAALFTYPHSYRLAGSSSPRFRRHILQTDKSLSRVCFFLWCCVILCLFLF